MAGAIYKLFMLQDGQCFEYKGVIYKLINLRCGYPAMVLNPVTGQQIAFLDSVLVRPVVGYTLVAIEVLPASMHRSTT